MPEHGFGVDIPAFQVNFKTLYDQAGIMFMSDGRRTGYWQRLTRKGDSLRLQYSSDGHHWPLLRLCYFPQGTAKIGMKCCTPERSGLSVDFFNITLTPPVDKMLHDLS
ncbi:hypothetical protein AWC35_19280 [Gibbsiella quercinecans]|uniref:DUF1349 domain-containing protein n=1 Tax=Gibbsiella quercinecans TaxID=929813 RepID=A0A250B5A0_9GAMM|nr:hypothetical protein AWC35_19280 [Gibbsiella quercinecans]RLM07423.1 hypothetical protein BIY31_13775 [Gibbsiella quercinecans]RLM13478.1 hypothetical protein BIY30_05100 [Gibbsiella quercinecans]